MSELDTALKQIVNDNVELTPRILPSDDKLSAESKFRQAISSGNNKVVEEALEKGLVDINCAHPQTMQTPIHVACSAGNISAVKILIAQEGIVSDAKDMYGNKPVDLLGTDNTANEIRRLIDSLNEGEEESNPVEKFGKITPIAQLNGYKYHVFICHAYKDKASAKTLKGALEELGVVVSLTTSMVADEDQVRSTIEASRLVIVQASKTLFQKISDPDTFSNSSCVLEMNSFVGEKDMSEILIVGKDSDGNNLEKWQDCPEYESVAEEGIVFDVSNSKVMQENLSNLYKEVKFRVN